MPYCLLTNLGKYQISTEKIIPLILSDDLDGCIKTTILNLVTTSDIKNRATIFSYYEVLATGDRSFQKHTFDGVNIKGMDFLIKNIGKEKHKHFFTQKELNDFALVLEKEVMAVVLQQLRFFLPEEKETSKV